VDCSLSTRSAESGIVDQAVLHLDDKGAVFSQVRLLSVRTPHVGDKFSSRHGQKGTCGFLCRHSDLPFSSCGMVPDIVVNPHGIPSRMTVGHVVECLLSKLSCLSGKEGDATPFSDICLGEICDSLHRQGYQRHGWEIMYGGISGRSLSNMIFLGLNYYQRLRHMVQDKIHARSEGRVTALTRQVTEGRSCGGGLRFGEMERDCVLSHGSSFFMQEKTLLLADAFRLHLCSRCGLTAIADIFCRSYRCTFCNGNYVNANEELRQHCTSRIVQVVLPYSAKLLFQEMLSLLIIPRLLV
jgi:DNA-directed RNA polymerase II subunit RPB2